jgi:uncharacterized membrane protein YgcG
MRNIDFSSWHTMLSTLLGLAMITLIGVGLRLVVMQVIQQRRERENRQINERLRTLITAYKTLGGSFTGNLAVSPAHLRDLRHRARSTGEDAEVTPVAAGIAEDALATDGHAGAERARRIRDAVETALSDIILLGTDEQVRLAAHAATELVAGRPVHTAELVVSLRDFIRSVLNLEPVSAQLSIPQQGPARPTATKGKSEGGAKDGAKQGGGGGGGMGGAGGGGGGMGGNMSADDDRDPHR